MRRAQSMGINLVIVAAIALLVLVIIGMIVTSGGQKLAAGTKGCLAEGGRCMDPLDVDLNDYRDRGTMDCEEPLQCYIYRYD